jgi:Flp pilus assembly pilin Flp
MSDLILRTAVKTRVTTYDVAEALARRTSETAERFRREQTGQDLVEYGGVLLVVALIIGAIIATSLPDHIANLIKSAVDNVFSGQSKTVTAK